MINEEDKLQISYIKGSHCYSWYNESSLRVHMEHLIPFYCVVLYRINEIQQQWDIG